MASPQVWKDSGLAPDLLPVCLSGAMVTILLPRELCVLHNGPGAGTVEGGR